MSALESVAFDIETTGFGVGDEVTVAGFALPMGVRVCCQTGGRPATEVTDAVEERVDATVQVSTHDSERALLAAVEDFAAERLAGSDVLLVAYNGETWQSGFDLPFLRTRLSRRGVDWPFRDLPYADLMPLVTERFNTTEDGERVSDLCGVYETLCEGPYGDLDPFEESDEAVAAFEDDQFVDLVMHNVADVLRTRALAGLAERYCSKSDFRLKSLTPTIHD